MRLLSLFTLLFILPLVLFGTSQDPDILIVNGQPHELLSTPLYSYFTKDNPSPLFLEKEGTRSSANWRGYVATWEIKENSLYLVKIEKEYQTSANDVLDWKTEMRIIDVDRIMPGKSYPVFASWYSGTLIVPEGEVIHYVHMGFQSVYEKTVACAVKDGAITEQVTIENFGPNLYRSQADLLRCTIGNPVFDASGNWIDARLLKTAGVNYLIEGGESFKTRGTFFAPEEGKVRSQFWIPGTPKSAPVTLYIYPPSANQTIANGSAVEIQGHFNPNGNDRSIIVEKIRVLEPGETMHDPAYPAIASALDALTKTYNEDAAKLVRNSVEKTASPSP